VTPVLTAAEAEAMSKRLVSALGSGWALTSSQLSGVDRFTDAILVKIWHNGHEFATGWTWQNLLQQYCWRSSLAALPWETTPCVAASSVEELRLKLEVLA